MASKYGRVCIPVKEWPSGDSIRTIAKRRTNKKIRQEGRELCLDTAQPDSSPDKEDAAMVTIRLLLDGRAGDYAVPVHGSIAGTVSNAYYLACGIWGAMVKYNAGSTDSGTVGEYGSWFIV